AADRGVLRVPALFHGRDPQRRGQGLGRGRLDAAGCLLALRCRARWRALAHPGALQELDDLLVGDLRELVVVDADRPELLELQDAYDLVANAAKRASAVRRAGGHREDDVIRAPSPDRMRSGSRRRSGGEAAIDGDGGTGSEVPARGIGAMPAGRGV